MPEYEREDILVYVAGPYTGEGEDGNPPVINTRNALNEAEKIADKGFTIFVPHLFHFWEFLTPRSYEFWMELDERMLHRSDVMYRFAGESSGADSEEAYCREVGIPVFRNLDDLVESFEAGKIEPRIEPKES